LFGTSRSVRRDWWNTRRDALRFYFLGLEFGCLNVTPSNEQRRFAGRDDGTRVRACARAQKR